MNQPFDFLHRIASTDWAVAMNYIGDLQRLPDLVIAPEEHGEYLFRWYVVPRNKQANIYFHIQTQSDPERPLHDHPWDNTSVILAGGYAEIIEEFPMLLTQNHPPRTELRKKGDVIHRKSTTAHRLIRPDDTPYTMSLFMTGPKVRDWGFWFPDGWRPYTDVTDTVAGVSTWKEGAME